MNDDPKTILQHLRALIPARPLQYHEARGIAERQALKLLTILAQYAPPVDVGLIAELPRIEVRVVRSRQLAGLSGLSEWSRNASRWLVAINGDDSQTRRRFSLAHEFKHIVDNQAIHVMYQGSGYPEQSTKERVERMCDYFAACLLMPRPWVKRLWTQVSQDADRLAATFNVSPAAMNLRLQQLGLVEPRSRWHRETTQRYFRTSPARPLTLAAA